jgi:hypothetical protein
MRDDLSASEEIIRRLKKALGVASDGQLATYLGISRQNIGAARKRESVPAKWIFKVAELTGMSTDWLGFGQGAEQNHANYASERSSKGPTLASPQAPYQRSAGSVSSPGIGGASEPQPGFGEAVEMLSKIYHSGNPELINAISANLRAFVELIQRRK